MPDAFGLPLNRPDGASALSGDGRGYQFVATPFDSSAGLTLGCYVTLADVVTEQCLLANVEAALATALTVKDGLATLTQGASAWQAAIAAGIPTAIVATAAGVVYTGTEAAFAAGTAAGTAVTIPATPAFAIGAYPDGSKPSFGDIDDAVLDTAIRTEAEARDFCLAVLDRHGFTPAWAAVI